MEPILWSLMVVAIVLVVLLALGMPLPLRAHPDPHAAARAEALVRQLLTPQELEQLDSQGYLEVPSQSWPGRAYRVRPDRSPVAVVENGIVQACLCLQPVEPLPGREIVLAHKLPLEADERGYWARANLVAGRGIEWRSAAHARYQ